MNRRNILLSSAAAALLAVAPSKTFVRSARADGNVVGENEHFLGDAAAPVTIVEYSSLTCPHCATFHESTLPQVKAEWIDTGKARLVYRHYPLDRMALAAALVADCLDSTKARFGFLEILFKNQSDWSRANDPMGELAKLARLAGVSRERFEACVTDEAEVDRILATMLEGRETFGVEATPTLIINGRKVEGSASYENVARALQEAHEGS